MLCSGESFAPVLRKTPHEKRRDEDENDWLERYASHQGLDRSIPVVGVSFSCRAPLMMQASTRNPLFQSGSAARTGSLDGVSVAHCLTLALTLTYFDAQSATSDVRLRRICQQYRQSVRDFEVARTAGAVDCRLPQLQPRTADRARQPPQARRRHLRHPARRNLSPIPRHAPCYLTPRPCAPRYHTLHESLNPLRRR